jgi:hypothetical protein
MATSGTPDVRCRQIGDADIDAVVDCLRRGFPYRRRNYWIKALARMARRDDLTDFPKYGFLLEAAGKVVGVLLAIYSRHRGPAGESVRCNLSSYCVDVGYRGFAPLLHMVAVKRKDVTYLNISAAEHTRSGIEALKFRRYCDGQMMFAPILSPARSGARIVAFATNAPESALLSESEREILSDHAALGCRALVCVEDGAAFPFVLQRRAAFHRLIPCEQLIYCRDIDEFARFAGAIARHLLLRTWPIYVADSNGPVAGLVGKYFAGYGPKYFKGPVAPRLGDLSYSELVILGR